MVSDLRGSLPLQGLDDHRPIERALSDIIEKRNGLPANDPDRARLEQMIQALEAEIAERNTRE